MNPIIALNRVTKSYAAPGTKDALAVLRGVSLDIKAGTSTSIAGPSGSGKSTLLHIMGALDQASSGNVTINDNDLSTLNDSAISALRNTTLGFIFQNHYLLPQLSVLENVLVPLLPLRTPTKEDAARAEALLRELGLLDRQSHRPAQLSGGECQRVAVARALINTPKVILADEPTGALDERNADTLSDLLFGMQQERGIALVMVTHSTRLAERATRRLSMHNGQLADASQ
jgi:lipoprotein-releasing system ATP-binding protein